jgi:hypothetical protein
MKKASGTRHHVGTLCDAPSPRAENPKPDAHSLNPDDTNSDETCRGGSPTAQTRIASTLGFVGQTYV